MKRPKTCKSRLFVLAGLLGLLPLSAKASDAVLLNNDASRCEIFHAISPEVPADCELTGLRYGKTRGIRVRDDDKGLAETGDAPRDSFSIAMRIQFKFDSAELTSESKTTLGQIAQVLQDDLMRDKVILLEGHADALGAESYNFHLSQRRASSVRSFLMTAYGLSGERLQAVGRGELDPYDTANPRSAVNRRVEFTNLTDGS